MSKGPTDILNEMQRVITCDLTFDVTEHAEIVVQIAAADSAGRVVDERLELAIAGSPPLSAVELRSSVGERMHVIRADPGRLSVSYRSQLQAAPQPPVNSRATRGVNEEERSLAFEKQNHVCTCRPCGG